RAAVDETLESPVGDARWWYRRYRHDRPLVLDAPDLATAPALGALAEHGLADQATVLLGLSSRIIGGGHSGYHGALTSTRTVRGRAAGQSIDALLATLDDVRRDTPFDAFRVGIGTGRPVDFGTCAYGPGRAAPLILQADAAYELAYGAFAGGDAGAAFERRDRMLRFAARDLEAAERRFDGDPSERAKLGTHGESIGALLEAQDRLREMSVEAPPAPEAGLSPIPRLGSLLDLAVSTLIDGLTSVAVVGSGTGGAFGLTYSSISSTGRHDMQHQSARDPAMRQAVWDVTTAEVSELARAVKRLDDAGILGETVVVYVGDNGEQHHSTASEFPVLLIGGGDLGLRGGRTVVYPGVASEGNRQLSNLWNTLGYLAGATLDDFGGEEGDLRRAFGPLGELMG
ncbi:MAG TPA: DUF1552 domain-containing protein, partial [Polyangiaceae bacterium LLY-WYZ-15_(1-7)]|nr:DUF1552 domain-containing protein [Polyangiaceae bacterium LLY-WYZ-15_(1-7)]